MYDVYIILFSTFSPLLIPTISDCHSPSDSDTFLYSLLPVKTVGESGFLVFCAFW